MSQSLIQADKNLRMKTFFGFNWLNTSVCIAAGLLHSHFKYQSVTITAASLPYLPDCSAVIQTDTVHMNDWLRVSFIFFTLSLCDEKNSKPCCLITGGCNQSERGQNSKSRLREKKKKKGAKNQWDGNKFRNLFHFVFKEFFIWGKLTKSTAHLYILYVSTVGVTALLDLISSYKSFTIASYKKKAIHLISFSSKKKMGHYSRCGRRRTPRLGYKEKLNVCSQ